jgi:retron-type reverse transcriptase
VVAQRLMPVLEPLFHASSYGYRPGRSAHDALRAARQQCWRHDWMRISAHRGRHFRLIVDGISA